MSLSAKLQLGDNISELYNSEYSVVECRYEMSKHYNKSARTVDSMANKAKIELTVVAPLSSDFTLYNWYIELMVLCGRVVIDLSSIQVAYNDKSSKTICFEDAYCISISENYNIDSLSRRELTLTLLAKELSIDTVDMSMHIRR